MCCPDRPGAGGAVTLFLATFFFIYGSLHLYVFIRARSALRFGAGPGTVLGLFMSLMVFVPIMVRQLERLGMEVIAMIMSYIGYLWMGILFIFISWSLLIDIYRLAVWLCGRVFRLEISRIMPSARLSFFLPAVFALAIGVYGYFEASTVRTEHLIIKTAKIPKENNRFRIVQISDVHLGLIVGEARVRNIIEEIRAADPDILVATGDLVDGQLDGLNGLSELLKGIDTPYGKFAIPGNHEYYAGFEQSAAFIRESGFRLLDGEAVTLPGLINIAGVDDPAARRFGLYNDIPESELLAGLDPGLFTLLLKHKPIVNKDSPGMFDLQLSGHTHRGQIFPFRFIVRMFFPKVSGHFDLKEDSHLYVSRGTGTWGPPIRFLSPPEVTVIDLVREDK